MISSVVSAVGGGIVSEVEASGILMSQRASGGRGGGGGGCITEFKAFCRSLATCKHSTSSNRQKTLFHVVG